MNKRDFLKDAILFFPAAATLQALASTAEGKADHAKTPPDYDATRHWYGMGIDVDKCIGCNRCVEACKAENDVPQEPFFFRTWIERYQIHENGETTVECISTRAAPPEQAAPEDPTVVRTFFVPKLCNQCAHPPCVQVCPVGATFQTQDGVVLVDEKRCIGCRYCIQACPYGARYLNPRTKTADKCTFCYHRVTEGLLPPCVQVCPVGATFSTQDGVVLVDEKRCIGCRYCIQACPYGARYLNPKTRTADKCTFCYHRITEGLLPACVEVCPTEARIFGDLKGKADRLVRFHRVNQISVLKPDLNTEPKVLYARLDGEVR